MLEDVLVIDSDVSSRDAFFEVLTSIGYRVTCVPNGHEGLLRMERERPSLVVVDLDLSHMDGIETIAKIREFDPEINSVLLVSQEITLEIRARAEAVGVLSIIKKDFSNHLMMKDVLGLLKQNLQEIHRETRQGSILVVDDEAEIRNLLGNFLSSKGYKVVTAGGGEEALLLLKSERPQLVLCDMRMPGMDGLMILRKILQIDPEVKVVMLSAIHDEELVAQAFKEGARDYLSKPCSLLKLDALVISILPRLGK